MPSLLSIFLPTLVFGSVIWVLAIALASTRPGLKIACGACAALFCLSFLIGSVQGLLQSLLILIVGLMCLSAFARWRAFAVASAVASVAAAAVSIWGGSREVTQVAEMREQYPMQSLEQRLAYESLSSKTGGDGDALGASALNPAVTKTLAKQESQRGHGGMRSFMLERLHSVSYARFVASQGFGFGRMIRVTPRYLDLPETEPVPLPDAPPPPEYPDMGDPALATDEAAKPQAAEREALASTLPQKTLESLHWRGSEDFTDGERMGYVERRDRVAGFESHRLTQPPEHGFQHMYSDWQVTRLELISLLKHDPPRAYESEHLPNMDELRDAATRPLDEFETRHLPELRASRDVVFEEGRNQIRMLGSLRAGTDCLQCHNVRRGDLLGVFTYVLDRKQPLAEPRVDEKHAGLPTVEGNPFIESGMALSWEGEAPAEPQQTLSLLLAARLRRSVALP